VLGCNTDSDLRYVSLYEPIGVDVRRPQAEPRRPKPLALACNRDERPIATSAPASKDLSELGLFSEAAQGRTHGAIVPEERLEQHLFEKRPV